MDQRRQQRPNHSCLACIAKLGQCGAGWQVLRSEAALKSAHPKAALKSAHPTVPAAGRNLQRYKQSLKNEITWK